MSKIIIFNWKNNVEIFKNNYYMSRATQKGPLA